MTAATSFESLGLSARISENVKALGYQEPTPIQVQAIPAVLQGRDLIGLAQTGTGKTAAFALPMIKKLSEQRRKAVRALIVAPTRELAQQILEAIRKYSEGTGVKCAAIYGGVRMGSQLKRLREGVDLVVGCPGRLVDHVNRRTLDLSQVEMLVLDEADHMFDMGFLPDIKKLISLLPAKRQTMLFSATMPREIEGLARDVLTDPISLEISKGEMATTVSHALFPVAEELKTKLLEKILKQSDISSTIIFARTKQRTKRLADVLQRNGYKVASLQGNLSQSRRQEAIKGFRDGRYDLLVATDIAARGIDVQQVTHVINFDIPTTVEGYTHRIGRTGRAAREGEAFTLISRADEGKVRAIERKLGSRIERRKIDDFDYGREEFRESPAAESDRTAMRSARGPRRDGRAGGRAMGNRTARNRDFSERAESRAAPRSKNGYRDRSSGSSKPDFRERRGDSTSGRRFERKEGSGDREYRGGRFTRNQRTGDFGSRREFSAGKSESVESGSSRFGGRSFSDRKRSAYRGTENRGGFKERGASSDYRSNRESGGNDRRTWERKDHSSFRERPAMKGRFGDRNKSDFSPSRSSSANRRNRRPGFGPKGAANSGGRRFSRKPAAR